MAALVNKKDIDQRVLELHKLASLTDIANEIACADTTEEALALYAGFCISVRDYQALDILHEAMFELLIEDNEKEAEDAELPAGRAYHYQEENCPGHVASKHNNKICLHCGIHIDSLRPQE